MLPSAGLWLNASKSESMLESDETSSLQTEMRTHRPPGPRPYNGILAKAEKALVSFVNQLAMFEGVNPLHTT